MGRTRKWTSQVESKIEWTRQTVFELHKELTTQLATLRDSQRESAVLQKKLVNENSKFNAPAENTESPYRQKSNLTLNKGDCGKMSNSPSRAQSGRFGTCIENVDDTCQTSQDAEYERLEGCLAELECEVLELRKENQRIVKDRAEYENAIQRALLKGVSSLNVEALKVLRCTPIQSCGPPCENTTSIEPVENSKNCPGKSSGRSSKGRSCRNATSSNESSDTLNDTSGGRACQKSSARSDQRRKKSHDNNNMLLLLHQKDADNFGIQTNSNCCDNSASKKTSNCPANNCEKFKKSNYTC